MINCQRLRFIFQRFSRLLVVFFERWEPEVVAEVLLLLLLHSHLLSMVEATHTMVRTTAAGAIVDHRSTLPLLARALHIHTVAGHHLVV